MPATNARRYLRHSKVSINTANLNTPTGWQVSLPLWRQALTTNSQRTVLLRPIYGHLPNRYTMTLDIDTVGATNLITTPDDNPPSPMPATENEALVHCISETATEIERITQQLASLQASMRRKDGSPKANVSNKLFLQINETTIMLTNAIATQRLNYRDLRQYKRRYPA